MVQWYSAHDVHRFLPSYSPPLKPVLSFQSVNLLFSLSTYSSETEMKFLLNVNMQILQEGDWAGVTRYPQYAERSSLHWHLPCWMCVILDSVPQRVISNLDETLYNEASQKIWKNGWLFSPSTPSVENYLELRPRAIDPGWRWSRHRWTPLSSVQNVPVVSLKVNPPFKSPAKRVCPRVIGDVISRVSYRRYVYPMPTV